MHNLNGFMGVTLAGGLTLFLFNLWLMKFEKSHHMHRTHTVLHFLAGVGLAVATGSLLSLFVDLLRKLFNFLAGLIPTYIWSFIPTLIRVLPEVIPWTLGLIILIWFILDVRPKKYGGGMNKKTPWVAVLVGGAVGLLPPLASVIGIGG